MPQERRCLAIILAAGEGTRMKSARPKVLHEIAGRPMLGHVLRGVVAAGADSVAVVVGPDAAAVTAMAEKAAPGVRVFVQSERLGTAHAVLAARAAIAEGWDDVLVVYADTPLLKPETLKALRARLTSGADVAVLGFDARDPAGYGRLIGDAERVLAIREDKDAAPAERAILLCNAGPMALAGASALRLLDGVDSNNAQGEFYLTDVVALAAAGGSPPVALIAPESEVMGVNDRVQLAAAEHEMQLRLREAAMRAGATLIAPETVFLSDDVRIGRDVLIEPHVVIGRGVSIADGAVIHAFSHLEGATIGPGVSVGPFARLRPGADLAGGARVGNFVEVKNAKVEAGAKINHLSYIGDARVGAGANIGAGTITCNYDGFNKHRTDIGAGAFIGSNSALVAPVTIGDGAFIGSGSVITEDVAADALAIGRGRQVTKEGWAKAFRNSRPRKIAHD
jgi:bifunctional UDP-N-acetylglucosamine pyrophosphorylase/glucosamine-1-phosphate N-acetyltransferase